MRGESAPHERNDLEKTTITKLRNCCGLRTVVVVTPWRVWPLKSSHLNERGKTMQGFIIIDGSGDATETVCKGCYDNGITFKVNRSQTVFLGSDVQFEVPCSTCDTVIDGVEEEPKPTSFTVTVEVTVYADHLDIETGADAAEYVVDILGGYFEYSEATDVKEHF